MCSNPIKTIRNGSDITRTTRDAANRFFWSGFAFRSFWIAEPSQPDREQQNYLQVAPELVESIDKSSISAQKNTFALDPAWGSLKKSSQGQVAKNNNRPADNKK
ncbi:hypothetical protein [Pseudomonas sp. CFII64]|uniref:hypothetical protein n=1 Tax=Pseudomonas sp. CFII64 TaxID=911242 RepID=UPI0012EBDD8F|nr:hypothetical protein [Pseudomonas sp. CFII64]